MVYGVGHRGAKLLEEQLGIPPNPGTLYSRMKKLGIQRPAAHGYPCSTHGTTVRRAVKHFPFVRGFVRSERST
jgi:hypothetical protein